MNNCYNVRVEVFHLWNKCILNIYAQVIPGTMGETNINQIEIQPFPMCIVQPEKKYIHKWLQYKVECAKCDKTYK